MQNDIDILLELENENTLSTSTNEILTEEKTEEKNIKYHYSLHVNTKKEKNKLINGTIFLIKYVISSSLIFAILLLGTNYSAYYNIAQSYLQKDKVEKTSEAILNSVEASNLKEKVAEENIIVKQKEEEENTKSSISIKKYKQELDNKHINIDIEITPFENRIVIPKLGKNIPLLDIKNRIIEDHNELEDIFMKELENGVIRYPGSAKPGEKGNSFIFGHSSNFPWMNGEFNDVFSTLDTLKYGDKIIIYYGQEKYTYEIREKRVITPGDVSILKRNKNKKELSIMTCWPIGTTLKRLVVTGQLVEEK